jgi:pimeloyl-ACP methyl ester carboxylesterase
MLTPEAMAGVAAAAAALGYGSLYAAWVNARWPALGQKIKTKSGRLHVQSLGEGPPVVCLHGASANGREFLPLAALLQDETRVLLIDRPGHGHSSRPAGAHRLDVAAGLMADTLDVLEIEQAVIVAHSLGAATALRLALERPDLVRGLVLAAPASHPYPGANAWHVRWANTPVIGALFARLAAPLAGPLVVRGAIKNVFAPAIPPEAYAQQAGVGLTFRPKVFRANARDVAASKRELTRQYFRYGEIQAPCVVITSDTDKVVSPRIHARALARDLPNAELIATPGAGHMPHQVRPEVLAAAVKRILSMTPQASDG